MSAFGNIPIGTIFSLPESWHDGSYDFGSSGVILYQKLSSEKLSNTIVICNPNDYRDVGTTRNFHPESEVVAN